MSVESTIQKVSNLVIVAYGLMLLSSFGCAATQQGIPTGQWSGQGTYVDYEAIPQGKPSDLASSRSKDGVYETSLKISQQQVHGHEALIFNICSKRGELFNVEGNKSHIEFTLVPLTTLAHGAKLYACCDWAYNPTKERSVSKEEFDKRLQTASASCIQQDGATILQIYYITPSNGEPTCFFDTFLFEGNQVRKTGRLSGIDKIKNKPDEEKLIRVYWTETLQKR